MTRPHTYHGEELLRRIADGEHDAFQQLFEQYAEPLHAAVYHYTKSIYIAQEITQEVFVRLWKHRDKLRTVENTNAYIYRMLFNLVNTYLRKESNEQEIRKRAQRKAEDAGDDTTQAEVNELSRIIQEGVEQLPPQKKIIYRMSREQGMDYREIGEQLNLSSNTVRNHLVEATKQLKIYVRNHALELAVLILQLLKK